MSRTLASESSFVFKDVQRKSINKEILTQNELIKCSHKYRSMIHATVDKIDDNDEKDLYKKIELIWHLCEILFIDIKQPGLLMNQLLIWIRWHQNEINEETEQLLSSSTSVNDDNVDSFWDLIIKYIIRGEIDTVCNLLEFYTDDDNVSIANIDKKKINEHICLLMKLLKKMPIYNKNEILFQFSLYWQTWSNECQSEYKKIQEKNNLNHEKLQIIFGLIAGDISVYKQILHLIGNWYNLMISILLYTDPCIKENDISLLASQCIDIYVKEMDYSTNSLDKILLCAFNFDLMQLIYEISTNIRDNWWMLTHLIDLLFNGNLLDSYDIIEADKLREHLILDYGTSLMKHSSLWFIALTYFDHCLYTGLSTLELLLERLSFQHQSSVYKINKIIEIADKRDLKSLCKSIYIIQSRYWLQRNKITSAFIYAIKSEENRLITHICDLYLKHYIEHKRFPDESEQDSVDDDILMNLGSLMLISERLTFLGKYYEFTVLRKKLKLNEAGTILISLLSSKLSPYFFLPTLLTDTIILLENDTILLDSEQTFKILETLEDFVISVEQKSFTNNQHNKQDDLQLNELKETEDVLRLAIARNMSRALVC